jgi:cytochrome c biogenesis protein CcmG, thiol:disulfide interchange protein DsbE
MNPPLRARAALLPGPPLSRTRGLPPLLALLLPALLLGTAGCGAEPDRFRPPAIGDPAPAYGAPTLDGDTITLAQLRGSPIMLNIWATWCPPCRDEMPGLQELHERYGERGLRVVGVSIDSRGSEGEIRQFLQDHGITFTILHDIAEDISQRFRASGVPQTWLIDRRGVIAHRWIGKFDPVAPDAIERVEAVLDAGS